MAIFTDTDRLPEFRNAVLTIGFFDGVHLGHTTILKQVVSKAKEIGGESVLITFEPHPRKLLYPNESLKLLTPLLQKLQLIQATGIEHIVVVPFTREFAALSAEEYIKNFLVKLFHPSNIVIGHDHRFGHDRAGDILLLKQFEKQGGYTITEIPAQLIDEAAVSSTKIRHALAEGRVQDAASMLGRNYGVGGTVIKGKQLGRTLGYPTANLQPADAEQLIPANGIYVVYVAFNNTQYKGMASIGFNPTVTDEKKLHIEANIFDFEGDIYNQPIEISFVARLRDEEKFESLDALMQQLQKDKEDSLRLL